jgi:hypothetical protein
MAVLSTTANQESFLEYHPQQERELYIFDHQLQPFLRIYQIYFINEWGKGLMLIGLGL